MGFILEEDARHGGLGGGWVLCEMVEGCGRAAQRETPSARNGFKGRGEPAADLCCLLYSGKDISDELEASTGLNFFLVAVYRRRSLCVRSGCSWLCTRPVLSSRSLYIYLSTHTRLVVVDGHILHAFLTEDFFLKRRSYCCQDEGQSGTASPRPDGHHGHRRDHEHLRYGHCRPYPPCLQRPAGLEPVVAAVVAAALRREWHQSPHRVCYGDDCILRRRSHPLPDPQGKLSLLESVIPD